MKAVQVRDKKTQSELLKDFSFEDSDGLRIDTFRTRAGLWEMDCRIVTLSSFPPTTEMEHTLRLVGYLFVAFKWEDNSNPWWHCNVLYGVQTPKDDEPFYLVMDPAHGRRGGLGSRLKTSFFQGGNDLFVGYHNKRAPAPKAK